MVTYRFLHTLNRLFFRWVEPADHSFYIHTCMYMCVCVLCVARIVEDCRLHLSRISTDNFFPTD